MKLAGVRAATFCARPDAGLVGALLHGPDAALVALRRRELVAALTDGDDLRLTRLDPAAARDPAEIDAALKARGFFPGRRVVLIEAAKDGLAGALAPILVDIGAEDAFLVVTAEGLPARSALRRRFEADARLAALGLHPEPPGAAELGAMLDTAGLTCGLTPDAAETLARVAAELDRGALMQLVEKIALNGIGRTAPLGGDELALLLPAAAEREIDRLVAAVAEGQVAAVCPLIARLAASGIGSTSMLIAAERHFRRLLALAAARDGMEPALGRLRPPAFGPHRQALAAQARRWRLGRLESACRLLFQADRSLRSAGDRPDRALVERCLLRLAMMAGPE